MQYRILSESTVPYFCCLVTQTLRLSNSFFCVQIRLVYHVTHTQGKRHVKEE